MADLGPVAWPPEPIRTERLVLRESEARDHAVFIELLASPEVGTCPGELPGEPVVLFTQTANVRSMRLAAKLGFTEVERFQAYGAEQWFGVWSSVDFGWQLLSAARPSCGAPGGYKEYRAAKRFGPRHRGFVLQRSWPGMGLPG